MRYVGKNVLLVCFLQKGSCAQPFSLTGVGVSLSQALKS